MTDEDSDPLAFFTDLEEFERLYNAQEKGKDIDVEDMKKSLKRKVLGQNHVVDFISEQISQQWYKEKRTSPIASFLFVGPPGTGKTELSARLAEYLFGSRDDILEFYCSQLKSDHEIMALSGSDGVWQGSGPGTLTQPVSNKPEQLILFDEVEKAGANLLDLLLSVLGEGRLKDNFTTQKVDFTSSIVIFTSNAELNAVMELQERISDPVELSSAIRLHLQTAKNSRGEKMFRPEFLDRLTAIFPFKPLSGDNQARIAALIMRSVAGQYGVNLQWVSPEILMKIIKEAQKDRSSQGARQLKGVIERTLGPYLSEAKKADIKFLRLIYEDDEILVEEGDEES